MKSDHTQESCWESIQVLGGKRPALRNLITPSSAKEAFFESPAFALYEGTKEKDGCFFPGEVTRLARVKGEGKEDLVGSRVDYNLLRSLFLRYWFHHQAPHIYDRCKKVLEGENNSDLDIKRSTLQEAHLWEESLSYALSNVALHLSAKRKYYRDEIMRKIPMPERRCGLKASEYQTLREMTAARIRSMLKNPKKGYKYPRLRQAAMFIEENNQNEGKKATKADGVGAFEQGMITYKAEDGETYSTGPEDVVDLGMQQLLNISRSGITTMYNNAAEADTSNIFPNSAGRGLGPGSSVL